MNFQIKILKTENVNEKLRYASAVYNLLETAYVNCGGINLANGFENEEDMLKNIPIWRLCFKGDILISVMLFKEKIGLLKMVAYAPVRSIDKTTRKLDLQFMINNSHVELSGKLLMIVLKEIKSSWRQYVSINPKSLIKKDIALLNNFLKTNLLPESSKMMYKKLKKEHPHLLKYCYLRFIGGELKLKLLIRPN